MNNSRIKNTSKNLLFAIVFQIVKILLVFINRIIFVKILGATYLGINGLFSNVIGILSLADLGMTTALMYTLYKPLADNDEAKIKQYMNYFKKIYNIIALTVGAIGLLLIPVLKYMVNLPDEMPNIYLYYILLLFNSVVSYLFVYKTTLLAADQKMYVINKYDTIFQFILFIMQVMVLLLTKSFSLYLFINLMCTLLCNFFKVKKAEKIYPFLKDKNIDELPSIEKKNIFKNLYSLFFYKLGGVIQGNTDNILISVFVGTITVGYYSNYSTIVLSVTTFLSIVFTSLKASIGNYVNVKTKQEQYKMFNILEVYNFWLVAFCSICFIVLVPDFIKICFGEEYLLGMDVTLWLVLNFYTSNIRQTIWAYRETTGIFTKTKFITIITSIINIVFSVLLGNYFGLVGIISATVIARMVYAWWKEPKILFDEYFNVSAIKYYYTYIKRLFLFFIVCIITYFTCILLNTGNIYLDFILKILTCLIITNCCFLLIYNNSQAIKYLKSSILKIRKKC